MRLGKQFVTPRMEGLKISPVLLHPGISDKTDAVEASVTAGKIDTSLHSV